MGAFDESLVSLLSSFFENLFIIPFNPKATAAMTRLEADGLGPGNGQVLSHYIQLNDPRIAKQSAQDFLEKENRLDILSTFGFSFPFTPNGLTLFDQSTMLLRSWPPVFILPMQGFI